MQCNERLWLWNSRPCQTLPRFAGWGVVLPGTARQGMSRAVVQKGIHHGQDPRLEKYAGVIRPAP
jgi:hypothetical protein